MRNKNDQKRESKPFITKLKNVLTPPKWVQLLLGVTTLFLIYFGTCTYFYKKLTFIPPNANNYKYNSPHDIRTMPEGLQDLNLTQYEVTGDFENVTFRSRDNQAKLSGWFIPADPDSPLIIVLHGFRSSKADARTLVVAGMLAKHNFNVLLFDFRNHGKSSLTNQRTDLGQSEVQDVLGALDWARVQKFPVQKIGIAATSLGANIALKTLEQRPKLPAFFLDSPFSDPKAIIQEEVSRTKTPKFVTMPAIWLAKHIFKVDLLASPPKSILDIHRPFIQIVHGRYDERISVQHAYEFKKLLKHNPKASVWVHHELGHCEAMLRNPKVYEQTLIHFFNQAFYTNRL